MSLTQLMNRPLTIVRRSESGELSELGNEIPTEELVETVGELQQRSRSEQGDHAELSDTLWDLFLPAGTEITTADGVVVDGELYELVGQPWAARNPRTMVASHVEATLRRTAGAEDGS